MSHRTEAQRASAWTRAAYKTNHEAEVDLSGALGEVQRDG
jgi:hypothetical protein